MRTKLVAGAVLVLFVVVGIVLSVVRFGPSTLLSAFTAGAVNTPTPPANNAIARENTQLGSLNWMIAIEHNATTQIQAYSGATSVSPGQSITFYVSVEKDKTKYNIDIYRLGWYAGAGGRLMTSVGGQVGKAQGYYNVNTTAAGTVNTLSNCKKCSGNGIVQPYSANWDPSYTLNVPRDWTTGVYLAKFTDARGMQTYAPFDVLGSPNATYVVSTPDTTMAAYNYWGGPLSSLYNTDTGSSTDTGEPNRRSVRVSFNKPYVQGSGAGQVLTTELQAIRWMEQHNYDISYVSSVDLQTGGDQLLNKHKAFISLGQDAYWTKEMRDSLDRARDRGMGMAFLGAGDGYWQMRFEPDQSGHANRTVVCYKVLTNNPRLPGAGASDLTRDPSYPGDRLHVTSQFRDPVLARPENALIGVMYADETFKQLGYPWIISNTAKSSLLNGTGLQAGKSYGCFVVGNGWDSIPGDQVHAPSPTGLQTIAISKPVNDTGVNSVSHTTYYVSSGRGLIFASGSIFWSNYLDGFRSQDQLNMYRNQANPKAQVCASGYSAGLAGMEMLMKNVMDALIVPHTPGAPLQ